MQTSTDAKQRGTLTCSTQSTVDDDTLMAMADSADTEGPEVRHVLDNIISKLERKVDLKQYRSERRVKDATIGFELDCLIMEAIGHFVTSESTCTYGGFVQCITTELTVHPDRIQRVVMLSNRLITASTKYGRSPKRERWVLTRTLAIMRRVAKDLDGVQYVNTKKGARLVILPSSFDQLDKYTTTMTTQLSGGSEDACKEWYTNIRARQKALTDAKEHLYGVTTGLDQ